VGLRRLIVKLWQSIRDRWFRFRNPAIARRLEALRRGEL